LSGSWQDDVLARVLEGQDNVVILLGPYVSRDLLSGSGSMRRADVRLLPEAAPPESVGAVVLIAPDPVSLRRYATAVSEGMTAHTVAVLITQCQGSPPILRPRPAWPRILEFEARADDGAYSSVTFDDAAPVADVLWSFAQAMLPHRWLSSPWPRVGVLQGEPHRWPVADRSALVGSLGDLQDFEVEFPPSLIVTDEEPQATVTEGHPVVSGPRVWVGAGPEFGWEDAVRPAATMSLRKAGPLSLGGLDEGLLNPHGFKRQFRQSTADLLAHPDPDRLTLRTAKGDRDLSAQHGPSDQDIPSLRRLAGVRIEWEGCRGPHSYARVVAGLAMAGVPLVCDRVPPWAEAVLHPDLVSVLRSPVNVDDILDREVHSIRLRRAALRHHSMAGWRVDAARRYGLQEAQPPRVSVLLPTKRPDQLRFAVNQVVKQQGAQVELILAAHGFTPDPALIAEAQRSSGLRIEAFEASREMPFGAVLNQAATRASGDVLLKMDDDDWYGRDFVADLLLTRSYSGADVVGTPPEFTFVDPLWITVRRQDATEAFRPIVAGGTIMVTREVFLELGGFRETRKHVDAAFLAAVRHGGGAIYRGHGHGYVLRRGSGGHTWDPGLGYFVSRKLSWQQWRGFRPSPLLQPTAGELPRRAHAADSIATAKDD
jgi:hypothetical protein